MSSNQFELSDPPADVVSAVNFSRNTPTRLLVSSWDKHIYLYDTHVGSGGQLIKKFEHRAPVLDVCFGNDENEAFSVGLDWDVRRIDLESGEQTVLSSHADGVNCIVYDNEREMLISASWDATLHIHLLSRPDHTPCTLTLPEKAFSLSLSPSKLVVAMASRQVHIYDLPELVTMASQTNNPAPNALQIEPFQSRESSLKFMTRAVACMPNDAGFASGSIEGRVAVEWFDPSEASQARKYAFKCHRQPIEGGDLVYPVNALAFHPIRHGTFASGGGDGVVSLWDGVAKRRIRQYQKFPASVAALCFSCDGKYLAVGVSPGFEDGKEDMEDCWGKIFIREMGDEVRVKSKDK